MIESVVYWSGVLVLVAAFWMVIPVCIHLGNTLFDRCFVRTRSNTRFLLGIFYSLWYGGTLNENGSSVIEDPDGNKWVIQPKNEEND